MVCAFITKGATVTVLIFTKKLCVHFQRFDDRLHRVLCLFVTFATVGDCIQRLFYEIENGLVIPMIVPLKLVQESEGVI